MRVVCHGTNGCLYMQYSTLIEAALLPYHAAYRKSANLITSFISIQGQGAFWLLSRKEKKKKSDSLISYSKLRWFAFYPCRIHQIWKNIYIVPISFTMSKTTLAKLEVSQYFFLFLPILYSKNHITELLCMYRLCANNNHSQIITSSCLLS